jgi:hypothetical protein
MKNGTKIVLGVVGGLAVAGLAFGGARLLGHNGKPSPEVTGGTVRTTASTPTPARAPAPAAPPSSSPPAASSTPPWASNVNGVLSVANNLFNTGLGFARQLGIVS